MTLEGESCIFGAQRQSIMNKVVIGLVALLVIVGGIVYAARGAINRQLTQVVPRIQVRPLASLSPLPFATTIPLPQALVSPLPGTTPLPFATPTPGSQFTGLVNPSPQVGATPRTGAVLPATGL